MIIIGDISGQNQVKIPNNLMKSVQVTKELFLKNTETKKEYKIEFTDDSTCDLYYVWEYDNSLPVGEYEYRIDNNIGILRVGKSIEKKVYDNNITFKSYNG